MKTMHNPKLDYSSSYARLAAGRNLTRFLPRSTDIHCHNVKDKAFYYNGHFIATNGFRTIAIEVQERDEGKFPCTTFDPKTLLPYYRVADDTDRWKDEAKVEWAKRYLDDHIMSLRMHCLTGQANASKWIGFPEVGLEDVVGIDFDKSVCEIKVKESGTPYYFYADDIMCVDNYLNMRSPKIWFVDAFQPPVMCAHKMDAPEDFLVPAFYIEDLNGTKVALYGCYHELNDKNHVIYDKSVL